VNQHAALEEPLLFSKNVFWFELFVEMMYFLNDVLDITSNHTDFRKKIFPFPMVSVGMVVTDSAQNINVFQYAPTGAQSHQQHHIDLGRQVNYERRLLCTTRYVKSVLLYMLVVLVVSLPVPIII
jgi:hypothetical protein